MLHLVKLLNLDYVQINFTDITNLHINLMEIVEY